MGPAKPALTENSAVFNSLMIQRILTPTFSFFLSFFLLSDDFLKIEILILSSILSLISSLISILSSSLNSSSISSSILSSISSSISSSSSISISS